MKKNYNRWSNELENGWVGLAGVNPSLDIWVDISCLHTRVGITLEMAIHLSCSYIWVVLTPELASTWVDTHQSWLPPELVLQRTCDGGKSSRLYNWVGRPCRVGTWTYQNWVRYTFSKKSSLDYPRMTQGYGHSSCPLKTGGLRTGESFLKLTIWRQFELAAHLH